MYQIDTCPEKGSTSGTAPTLPLLARLAKALDASLNIAPDGDTSPSPSLPSYGLRWPGAAKRRVRICSRAARVATETAPVSTAASPRAETSMRGG